MAFTTTAKGATLAAELAFKINQRMNGQLTVVLSVDTDGTPLITIGTPGTTNDTALIKVAGYAGDNLAVDSLGLGPNPYGPEVVMLATEKSVIGTGGGDYITLAHLTLILGEIYKLATYFQWFQHANGGAVATTDFAGTPVASFWPSQKWLFTQAQ